MENKADYSDDIRSIRKIMEESSRFLSLSGLSGVFAGVTAVAGGCIAQFVILKNSSLFTGGSLSSLSSINSSPLKPGLFIDALVVLLLALAGAIIFSVRKAKQKDQRLWTPVSKRLLVNLFIPLITGAFLIVVFCVENQWQYIIPVMLIFYGLSLVSAGKFTFGEVFYLGLAELITGCLSAVFHELSVFFWIFGFGILHIIYGIVMYSKYES